MEVQDEGKTNFVGSNHRYFRQECGAHDLRYEINNYLLVQEYAFERIRQ
jgi:hypothetical protein